jgi:hypothetical protein
MNVQQAVQMHKAEQSSPSQFIEVDVERPETLDMQKILSPSKVGHIDWFCKMVLQSRDDGFRLIICTGGDSERTTLCSLLIGSFLILCEDYTVEQAAAALQPIEHVFIPYEEANQDRNVEFSNHDCWQALHIAKQIGWLNFLIQGTDPETCLDMDEYHHYDSPANGDLHVIVPSKLIAIRPPCDISLDPHTGAARTWADDDYGRRSFSPAYYADVLSDFDVKLVVRCGQPSYDAAPFLNHGIAVEEMPDASTDAAPASLLRSIDRFLTLAQLAPGAIAVHCDEYGLGQVEVLIAAYLIRRCGFPALSAVAWLRMLHPAAHVPSLRFLTHAQQPSATLSGSRRHSVHGTAFPAGAAGAGEVHRCSLGEGLLPAISSKALDPKEEMELTPPPACEPLTHSLDCEALDAPARQRPSPSAPPLDVKEESQVGSPRAVPPLSAGSPDVPIGASGLGDAGAPDVFCLALNAAP